MLHRNSLLGVTDEVITAFLTNIVNTEGGVYFPMQEESGAVSLAVNPALATGRELYFIPNAASDPNGNEADATTGWVATNSTLTSDGAVKNVGSFSIKHVSTQNNSRSSFNLDTNIDLVDGKRYRITFDARHTGTGGDNKIHLTDSAATRTLLASLTSADTTFQSFSTEFTHDDDSNFLQAIDNSGTDDGGVYIDNISIKQIDIAASTAFPGSELLTDGDMEAGGVGDWDAVDATLTKQTGTRTGGSGTQVLRIAATASPGEAQQTIVVTAGKRYKFSGWTRSDGVATPQVTQSAGLSINGTTSTDWQLLTDEFVPTNSTKLRLKSDTSGQHVEWDDVTLTEVNPLNGDITGATVGVSATPKLGKAYTFDAANDFSDIHSAEINSIFDPTKGTAFCFAKVSGAGVWTDGIARRNVVFVSDSSNRILLGKLATNNELRLFYIAGGTTKAVIIPTSTTDWFMIAITWDTVADEVIVYLNGVKVGDTQTGLGTWEGNFSSTLVLIGADSNAPSLVWDGDQAHTQLLTEALAAADLLTIAQNGGVA